MAMLRKIVFALLTAALLTPGCIEMETSGLESEGEEKPLPFELTFESKTLDRSEDEGSVFSLEEELENGPVMLLWIGSGCSGCHDWTDLIREKMDNGELNESNVTIVSVHRWGQFESQEDVMEVFGTKNESSHYTPWKVVLPTPETQAYEFGTGVNTGASVYSAYGNPGTPTLQIIAENGVIAWQSKTYWANESVFEEGFSYLETQAVDA